MKPEVALETREQMLRDGYCVIPDILSQDFLQELRQESDHLNDTMEHHPDTKYQGTQYKYGLELNTKGLMLGFLLSVAISWNANQLSHDSRNWPDN